MVSTRFVVQGQRAGAAIAPKSSLTDLPLATQGCSTKDLSRFGEPGLAFHLHPGQQWFVSSTKSAKQLHLRRVAPVAEGSSLVAALVAHSAVSEPKLQYQFSDSITKSTRRPVCRATAAPSGDRTVDVHAVARSCVGESDSGSLQRRALLELLGASTSDAHITGPSLLARASMAVVSSSSRLPNAQGTNIFSEAGPQHTSDSSSGLHAAPWSPPSPLQLRAACLASIAAAWVRIPQVWGSQCANPAAALLQGLRGGSRGVDSAAPPAATAAAAPQQHQQQHPHKPSNTKHAAASAATTKQGSERTEAGVRNRGHVVAAGGPAPAAAAAMTVAAAPACAAAGTALTAGAAAVAAAAAAAVAANGKARSDGCGTRIADGSSGSNSGFKSGESSGVATPVAGRTDAAAVVAAAAAAEGGKEKGAGVAARPSFFEDPLRCGKLLLSGALSAVVSRTCVAPLERVKMDLLLKRGTGDALTTAAQVLRTEGLGGFWKGNALNVLRTAPFKAVNFFSFDLYHGALVRLAGRDGNTERFAAGALAGVTATLVCFPLDVVRTRLMAAGGAVAGPRYGGGPFTTLAGILRHEGAAALYTGCLPAVIGMAPAGAVFYGVYDLLKHTHIVRLEREAREAAEAGGEAAAAGSPPVLAPGFTLLYGAMAGAASELMVYPLEVVRRRMQLQSMAAAGMRQAGGHMAHMAPHHAAHHTNLAAAAAAAAAATGGAAGAAAAAPTAGAAAANAAAAVSASAPTAGSAAAAAAAAGGRLAASLAAHHPWLPGPAAAASQRALAAALASAAVARSPMLSRVAAAVAATLKTDGPRGFYSGLLPNMLQVLPSAALSYYTYDTLKTALGAQ